MTIKQLRLSVVFITFFSLYENMAQAAPASFEQELGQLLFTDKNLSLNKNQSCASCHSLTPVKVQTGKVNKVPGFADPDNVLYGTAVSDGSVPGKTGKLNAPGLGYAAYSPLFHWDETEELYVGGQFWNGRANSLAEQAKQPFLNPAEMAMPNAWAVVDRLKQNRLYQYFFNYLYGLDLNTVPAYTSPKVNKTLPGKVNKAYQLVVKAISAFERSRRFNKFNAKFDFVLAGKTTFTPLEKKGFELFNDEKKGNCAACHISSSSRDNAGNIVPPLFTDFTYDNIGLPRNLKIANNPPPDLGLGGRMDIKQLDPQGLETGKHKVMTLRNIAITPPYGHNGVFSTLEQIVHFYNTRDTLGWVTDNRDPGFGKTGWPLPEVAQNVNHDELGNLGLTNEEESAIVAFLKTLTDDYPIWGKDRRVPPGAPSPYYRQDY